MPSPAVDSVAVRKSEAHNRTWYRYRRAPGRQAATLNRMQMRSVPMRSPAMGWPVPGGPPMRPPLRVRQQPRMFLPGPALAAAAAARRVRRRKPATPFQALRASGWVERRAPVAQVRLPGSPGLLGLPGPTEPEAQQAFFAAHWAAAAQVGSVSIPQSATGRCTWHSSGRRTSPRSSSPVPRGTRSRAIRRERSKGSGNPRPAPQLQVPELTSRLRPRRFHRGQPSRVPTNSLPKPPRPRSRQRCGTRSHGVSCRTYSRWP